MSKIVTHGMLTKIECYGAKFPHGQNLESLDPAYSLGTTDQKKIISSGLVALPVARGTGYC